MTQNDIGYFLSQENKRFPGICKNRNNNYKYQFNFTLKGVQAHAVYTYASGCKKKTCINLFFSGFFSRVSNSKFVLLGNENDMQQKGSEKHPSRLARPFVPLTHSLRVV
ncbi:jg3367 [Pararge aegeria aegeria]|uniref:Jg3367 protein n=1 Tax=Pararge aegeria aegeria TaxID=348720 RepID=A0A8S4RQC8_9NEOP|nr:jg3367 [Pararge aegeria aegeria]